MAEQLGLDLPSRAAMGRDAFFVAPSNAVAMALIDRWPDWPDRKLALTGPRGSGKTHLAHVWADMAGARIIAAKRLASADIAGLAATPVVVENVPDIADSPKTQTALFHLHNLVLSEGHGLLLTGTTPVRHWNIALPDLASRLQGTTSVALDPPDDQLLSALLVKLLADRQLNPKADLISYLVARIDRSFAAAIAVTRRLDAASLAQKRPLTRQLAAEVLDNEPSNG